ncbi:MAG: hypothetical protein JW915_02600 [Chitinispirillaceae bacterium]|nr:hypothetical protein [Chitinispirillaceae bacterium]
MVLTGDILHQEPDHIGNIHCFTCKKAGNNKYLLPALKSVFIYAIVAFSLLIKFSSADEKKLSGVVLDEYGKAASGVNICACTSEMVLKNPLPSDMGQFDKLCTRTDRKGTYSLRIDDTQRYTIIGTRDNHRFVRHNCTYQSSRHYSDTLKPCGSLVFYIHKEIAQDHNNVQVSLRGTPIHSRTDRKGKIVFDCIPSGNYQAVILSGKPDYQDVVCSLHIATGKSDTFADTLRLYYKVSNAQTQLIDQEPEKENKNVLTDQNKPEKPSIKALRQISPADTVKPVKRNTETPSVSAGPDTIVGFRDAFTLKGSATIKEGKIIKREWAIGKQPFINTHDGSLPVIAPVKSGTIKCVFRAVADNDSAATDTVLIQVRSSPPRLNVKGDSIAGIFDSIHLFGKATDNGSVVSKAWDIGNTGQFTITDDTILTVPPFDNPPASLVCIFRAIDDDGETSLDTHSVIIKPLWKEITLPAQLLPRKGQAMTSFDGSLWIIGGNHSDIWRSPDLKKWENITDAAEFGIRYGHTVTAFDGYLYVTGGKHSEDSFANDIWKSSDGKSWRKIFEADFLRRHYHTVTEFRNRLWLIGGLGESDYESCLNDIWSSEDGVHWKAEREKAPFSRRYSHGTGVIDGSLFVVGGIYEGFTGTKNVYDIWSSPDGLTWKQESARMFSHDSIYFSYIQNGRKLWAAGDYCKQCGISKPFSVVSTTSNGSLWEDRVNMQPVYSRIFCAAAAYNSSIVLYPADSRLIYQLR